MPSEANSVEIDLPYSMDAFDFVEVDNNDHITTNEEEELEFAFPLFSSTTDDKVVTLRGEDEDIDVITEKHNKAQSDLKYGRVQKNKDLKDFMSTAIDYDAIFNVPKYNDKKSNSSVETLRIGDLINRGTKEKKKNIGQKQKQARKLGKEREEARKLQALEIKKLIKKKFHKRGGKRNANANAKPKSINTIIKF